IAWPTNGLSHAPLSRVFQEFVRSNSDSSFAINPDNQLASLFVRWAPPASGFEVYGEYGREDRNVDLRDFEEEPDHDAGYLVGFARAWINSASDLVTVLRGEVLNTRLSHLQQG